MISARDNLAPEVLWLRSEGICLNDAMALQDGNQLYTGSAALERILRLETMGSLKYLAPLLKPGFPGDQVYAALKIGRAMTLRLLRRKKISY